ncbi:MAG: hypothetical protein K0Q94_1541, partial [Paenibacillus sp.]|nr:hypothetical protein [Paenibacillus sp.]
MCQGTSGKHALRMMVQSTVELTRQTEANTARCRLLAVDWDPDTQAALAGAEQTAALLRAQLETLERALAPADG